MDQGEREEAGLDCSERWVEWSWMPRDLLFRLRLQWRLVLVSLVSVCVSSVVEVAEQLHLEIYDKMLTC